MNGFSEGRAGMPVNKFEAGEVFIEQFHRSLISQEAKKRIEALKFEFGLEVKQQEDIAEWMTKILATDIQETLLESLTEDQQQELDELLEPSFEPTQFVAWFKDKVDQAEIDTAVSAALDTITAILRDELEPEDAV